MAELTTHSSARRNASTVEEVEAEVEAEVEVGAEAAAVTTRRVRPRLILQTVQTGTG